MGRPIQEDEVLVLALSRGLITLQDIRDLENQIPAGKTIFTPSPQSGSRVHFLIALGKLAAQDVNALMDEIPKDADSRPEASADDAPTVPASHAARYRILNLLGQGGMGKVYKAHDLQLNRYVALKFIQAGDPEMQRRFLQEAQAQARVDHEAICRVYEVGNLEGRPYIAMQFIAGRTLKDAASRLTLEQKLQVMRTVAEAVHEAHRTGLIHRDLNPSNIMVEESADGRWKPYITDFGLAKEPASASKTAAGTIAGTPHYMAPEQASGDLRRLDRRADVYSLGATLYELLCGHPPFDGENALEVLGKTLSDDPAPLRRRNPSIAPDLDCITMKCLEKEPNRRYDSARAFAEDLTRYLNGEPILARPQGAAYRAVKFLRRHRVWVAAGTVAAAAVAGAGAGVRAGDQGGGKRHALCAHAAPP